MRVVLWAFLVICPITIGFSCWTFLFPLWRNCTFPTKDAPYTPSLSRRLLNLVVGNDEKQHPSADFRLLAFGDPQLEGDTSIWHANENALYRPSNLKRELKQSKSLKGWLEILKYATQDAITTDLPSQLKSWRKQLDLLGNDYYLAHIYRSLYRTTEPTHVTVLGDLLGSQWIDDDEFESRASRYWRRVFRHGTLIDNSTTYTRRDEILGEDPRWRRRVINVAGNHDIGYAGDITEERLLRFERAFGSANWEIVFHYPQNESLEARPSLRLVVLNSMNLDTPVKSYDLQKQTYSFINDVISNLYPVEDRAAGTILLTHIPLFKEAGVCTDGPFFNFHDYRDGMGVKEQNHLSYDSSVSVVLQGLFGMNGNPDTPGGGLGRPGLVLNGHDHEGCDTYHYLPQGDESDEDQPRRWNATRLENSHELKKDTVPGIREVTLRAMMGEFGGFAYMISAWFDFDANEWQFQVNRCSAGVQHWWWATHVLIIVTLGLAGVAGASEILYPVDSPKKQTVYREGKTSNMKSQRRS